MVTGSRTPPPQAPRHPAVLEVHGVRREDDYAWLRDIGDPRALEYLRAERTHYEGAVAHLRPLRRSLLAEMRQRMPDQAWSVSWRRGEMVYRTRAVTGRDAEEEYEQLLCVDPDTGREALLLDPQWIAPGTAHTAFGPVEPSPDGRLLAYSLDTSDEELFELRFRDLDGGLDLPDRIPRTSPGGAWSADSSTFFYAVLDGAHRPDRVLRHRLGTPVESDEIVLEEPDRHFELSVRASRDGGWVVLSAASRESSEVHLLAAEDPFGTPRLVAPRRPGIEYAVEPLPGGWDARGEDLLLVVTNDGAAEFRLMAAAVPAPGEPGSAARWKPVARAVASDGSERLESVAALAQHLVLTLRRDGEPFLRVLGREPGTPAGDRTTREVHPSLPAGQLRLWRVPDPAAGSVVVVEENLVTAPRWVQVELETGERRILARRGTPGADPTRYVTERLYARAPDGASVPVTIARLRELEPGATRGCLLSGFGAYEACSWPRFTVGTLSLLDRGVVCAVAHVRGGGELGRRWWLDGRLRSKQNTFSDFIAARDALVAAGWAAEDTVVARGRSAGGLLQGAVYSQAPQRWRAVVAEVPLVDVVTSMSDPQLPLTVAERDEWGDPLRDPDDFATMLAYSPYDNPPPAPLRPALLVTGSLYDLRVPLHEPAKWVAKLRATQGSSQAEPLLLRAELGDGLRPGPRGRQAGLRYEAEILAWVLDRLGAPSPL